MCVCVCVCEIENHIKFIEGDSEAKVNTLGGNWMSQCEEKSSHDHMSNSEWLHRQNCLNLLA